MRVAAPKARPATIGDLAVVGLLHHRHLSLHAKLDPDYEPPAATSLAQWHTARMQDRDQGLLVAECDGQLIGFATVRVEPGPENGRWRWQPPPGEGRLGTLGDLYIDEAHRRVGAGRALAEACCEWLKRHGATRVELTALAANPAALAFWQATGFTPHRTILRQEL